MTVRAKYEIDDVQVSQMQMTISITMTVSEWRTIADECGTKYPGPSFSIAIRDALSNVNKAVSNSFSYPA